MDRAKNFHFQEVDWIISFTDLTNRGRKYLYYSVLFSDLKKRKSQIPVCLGDILGSPEFENNYPHTVGFFKESLGNEAAPKINYLELRIVRSIEDFWKFLNDLDL